MSAGTIKLTNNSTAVTGIDTSFTTELAANDFLVAVVGGVTYTLGVKSVESNTELTLAAAYNGPTTTGIAWTPVPNATLVGITAQVAADVAKAIRGLNLDKNNWQQVFSGTGNVTVNLPDGSQFTGPAWGGITTSLNEITKSLNDKAARGDNNDITSLSALATAISIVQGGTGAKDAVSARKNLGLGSAAVKDTVGTGSVLTEGDYGLGGIADSGYVSASHGTLPAVTGAWRYGGGNQDPDLGQSYGVTFNGAYSSDLIHQIFIGGDCIARARTIRKSNGARMLNTLYGTLNTTRAADGTLKAASPVARIVKSQEESRRADIDEMDFEWCGAGTRNSEAAGITITRMDTGVYVLTGSLGLAKEGWQLSPPRDPMGSGDMGIVEAEETESGGITVRLYKRKFMLSDEGEIVLTKGPLIDVPPTSWIDIRLQMPLTEATERLQ